MWKVGFRLCLVWATASAGVGCKFMPNQPYWIEGFGPGKAARIAAWPSGALAIAPDALLYTYPGQWARPWVGQGGQQLKAVAGSNTTIYGVQSDGHVARFAGGHWQPIAGSVAWQASEIGVTRDDRLRVVADGKLREVEDDQLKGEQCGAVMVTAVAVVNASLAFVLDQSGGVHRATPGQCEALETPAKMQGIAATAGRLLGVAVDGAVWRRRDGEGWSQLPAPLTYRRGRQGAETKGRGIAVSAHSTWLLDVDGSVFLLSDEA